MRFPFPSPRSAVVALAFRFPVTAGTGSLRATAAAPPDRWGRSQPWLKHFRGYESFGPM